MNKSRSAIAEGGPVGLVPMAVTFFLAILMLLPLGSGVANIAMPHLAMISAFYWLVARPLLMPYGACAAIGLCLDLWLHVPLGLNMVLLLLTRLFVVNQIKHFRGRNRAVHWVVFSVMSLGLYSLSWLIMSAINGMLWPVQPLVLQWLVTAFSYAPLGFILGRLRRSISN